MNKQIVHKFGLTYTVTFAAVLACLTVFPPQGGYVWEPLVINLSISFLFTLLVLLTAHLLGIKHTLPNALCIALFLIVFCPGAERFFVRDEEGLMELGSQCIVPFFISQYNRVSRKNFHSWYFLMLLMGIFCSYTHNNITIPLCLAFVILSFTRKQFFRRACWPMVVGFVIGTALSLWQMLNDHPESTGIAGNTLDTNTVLYTLWEAKVFVFAACLTIYLTFIRQGRRTIRYFAQRNLVLTLCLMLSLLTLPLVPLGLENATTGLCFFSMLWLLSISHFLLHVNIKKTYNHYAVRKN